MSPTRAELLFDEFAVRHARGEAPDVRSYLAQAGDEREALGRMLDRFLESAPSRRATEEEVVLLQARAEQEPPLVVLRQRRRLGRQAVVDGLVRMLALDPARLDKVGRYYHELEVGLLDPNGVSRRVWASLRELLGADVESLAGARRRPEPPAAAAAVAYLRMSDEVVVHPSVAHTELVARAEPDEIDRLFTGGN
jgi:hypothetical protein